MVNFGDPISPPFIIETARQTHFSAHWTAPDFNVDEPTWNWGPDIWAKYWGQVLTVEGLSLEVVEAAPIAVVASPIIFVHADDTTGVCLGDFVNARADANSKLYSSLNIAVELGKATQVGGKIVCDGYAATDDLSMCVYGRIEPTLVQWEAQQRRSQYQSGEAREGFVFPEGRQTGSDPPPR